MILDLLSPYILVVMPPRGAKLRSHKVGIENRWILPSCGVSTLGSVTNGATPYIILVHL